MTMPNFLIIGTAKAGTTSLYYYLSRHPQIFMSPKKEPKFFAFEGTCVNFKGPGDERGFNQDAITDLAIYSKLFAPASNQKAIGEATTWYLYSEEAHRRIYKHIPEAKLIVVLRNPIDRAYSHFLHHVRDGREPLNDFGQAIAAEQLRVQKNWAWHWHYIRAGLYYDQLKRYTDTFDREQIKVYLYEELGSNLTGLLSDIFGFLDVDSVFTPSDRTRYNVSGIPKSRFLQTAINNTPTQVKQLFREYAPQPLKEFTTKLKNQNLYKPPLPSILHKELTDIFEADILKLQDLIKRDLSPWLKREP